MSKLSTEKYNILGSGSAAIPQNEYLRIEISPELIIQLHFTEDESKGQLINSSAVNGEYLRVDIYNAKGMGAISKLIEVGENDTTKKKISMSLAFQKYDNLIICNYTIFEEK